MARKRPRRPLTARTPGPDSGPWPDMCRPSWENSGRFSHVREIDRSWCRTPPAILQGLSRPVGTPIGSRKGIRNRGQIQIRPEGTSRFRPPDPTARIFYTWHFLFSCAAADRVWGTVVPDRIDSVYPSHRDLSGPKQRPGPPAGRSAGESHTEGHRRPISPWSMCRYPGQIRSGDPVRPARTPRR